MTNSSTRSSLSTSTCGRCGSWCDDLTRDQTGQRFQQACSLLQQPALPQPAVTATIAGQAVSHQLAMSQAVQILLNAKRPLIWGLYHATCEAQTQAINLAEALRGLLLTPDDERLAWRGSLVSRLGEARTTLGEIQRFADLVICLDCRPWEIEPRWTERWRLGQPEQRHVVTLETTTASSATAVAAQAALPTNWQRQSCSSEQLSLRTTEWQARQAGQLATWRQRTSNQLDLNQDAAWDQLAERFVTARYPVLVYHAEQLAARHGTQLASRLITAWEQIVLKASARQRTSVWPMRGPDNSAGAEYLLTARSHCCQTDRRVAVRGRLATPGLAGRSVSATDSVHCVQCYWTCYNDSPNSADSMSRVFHGRSWHHCAQ
jgi:hypothetical protein